MSSSPSPCNSGSLLNQSQLMLNHISPLRLKTLLKSFSVVSCSKWTANHHIYSREIRVFLPMHRWLGQVRQTAHNIRDFQLTPRRRRMKRKTTYNSILKEMTYKSPVISLSQYQTIESNVRLQLLRVNGKWEKLGDFTNRLGSGTSRRQKLHSKGKQIFQPSLAPDHRISCFLNGCSANSVLGVLPVIGLMHMPNIRIFPSYRPSLVREPFWVHF